jgi:N-acetylneuraminic acid mutarotase
MSGSNTYGAPGVYGVKGTPAATNVPSSRSYTVAVKSGGNLWLFGGITVDAGNNPIALNDLWKYDTSTGQWTWMSGSNLPNATGVYGTKGTPAPANAPGARGGAVAWAGLFGTDLLIFGGTGFDSVVTQFNQINELNDLWRYNIITGNWTWMNGSNLVSASGIYGTLGTPSVSNQPGARDSGTAWTDSNGHVWLFGGAGYDSAGVYDSYGLNDVWEYMP